MTKWWTSIRNINDITCCNAFYLNLPGPHIHTYPLNINIYIISLMMMITSCLFFSVPFHSPYILRLSRKTIFRKLLFSAFQKETKQTTVKKKFYIHIILSCTSCKFERHFKRINMNLLHFCWNFYIWPALIHNPFTLMHINIYEMSFQ